MRQKNNRLKARIPRVICPWRFLWISILGVGFFIFLTALPGCDNAAEQTAAVSSKPSNAVTPPTQVTPVAPPTTQPTVEEVVQEPTLVAYNYNPEGRRDPFSSILLVGKKKGGDLLPPLQRVELSQLRLIAIVWGGFGYSAMVQSSDGKGYTVRAGTMVGPNRGVVKGITAKNLVVQEAYTDIFGEKKTRDFVFQLHPQEEFE